ncbi:MAG: MerR family transcriptional regulator [Rhodobacteraceae bacterium]|nr:MerR family transcriptional regulator [Paracoccaceae bacterium]
MKKAQGAFRTISEVADQLGTQPHVLRFWESKFSQVKPVKRAGGRRYYRPADVDLLAGIKSLLHGDGLTIKGVQKVLKERGVKYVAAQAPGAEPIESDVEDAIVVPMAAPAEEPEASPTPGTDTPDPIFNNSSKVIRARLKVAVGADRGEVVALYERLRKLHAKLATPSGGF